ncbi:MAG: family 43 glycosylhydrolase [Lachnospiraceae bacterium]|nr:family 43 glycosylhydrolase [Lachnospiraceae bacterium]
MGNKRLKQTLACTLALSVALGNVSVPQKAKAAEETGAVTDITSGLVGYYDFENSLENKASATGGKAKVHGGAGNTWNNEVTGTENYLDSIEGFGQAYHFLGDTDAGRGEGLELDVALPEEFTISYWVNPKTVNSATSMVFSPVSLDEGLSIADNWGGATFPTVRIWGSTDNDSYLDNWIDSADALCGKWSHITLTCDANGSYSLYINGIKSGESQVNAAAANDLTGKQVFLGINFWDASFDGLMDEVRIYDRALTADDVAELSIVPTTGIEISSAGSGRIITNIVYANEADKEASKPELTEYGVYKCSASVIPACATDKAYTWSVDESSIATISSDGLVTLNENARDGDTITVKATFDADNTIYDKYTLTVEVNESVRDDVEEITDGNAGEYYQKVKKDRVSVHDPSIIKDTDGTYYIFGSHLAWAKSKDLINWTPFANNINTDYRTLFKKEFEWASIGDSGYDPSGNLWAPDVIWNKDLNKWCMYMSINGNSWNSSICMLTADRLDGNWTYNGTVVYSGFGKDIHDYNLTDYKAVTGETELNARYLSGNTWNPRYGAHAIDPCVFYDEKGKLWFTYGSWSGGIYMFELDKATGYRLNTPEAKANYTDAYMGKKLGGSSASGEASYIEYINGYYYMFLSYGGLLANGGYNMRVFRSENPDGPYKDISGNAALEGGAVNGNIGTRLMSYYKWSWWDYAHVAQGHNSAFVDDDGKAYLVYHTRTNDGTEGHSVRVHQLFTTESGYLVAAPFEYSISDNVAESGYSLNSITGTYEVILQENTNNTALEYNKPKKVSLNSDGTVSGDITGTWETQAGTPFVSFNIGGIIYEGVFVEQNMEGTNVKTLCFTAAGNNDICLWGAKYPDNKSSVAWASSYITIPSNVYSDLELQTEGIFGTTIKWESDNTAILGNDGVMTGEAGTVTLKAVIRKGGCFRVISKKVTVVPKDASGKTLVAEYFTDNAADLEKGITEGTYQYTNPFNKANITGLDINNGVSISFDYERKGTDIAKLGAIFAFNVKAEANPKMFLTDGTYFGYNGWDGNYFDANNDFETMKDFIGTGKKHIELVLEPSGFTLNVDGKKAYNTEDFNAGIISNKINESGTVNYSKMLKWLNETADELNFGWGSFWTAAADAVKAKISNVKFYVLPEDNISADGYVYYEDYNKSYDLNGKWITGRGASGTIGNNGDDYKNYANIAADSSVAVNGSASTDFGTAVTELGNYVIELDVALRSGNVAQRSMSEFVITGTDCNAEVTDIAQSVTSGYILKLATKALEGEAGKGTANTEDWYINGSETKITLPLVNKEPQWIHIKAVVNKADGKAVITITDKDKELYTGQTAVNGKGSLKGLYVMAGRGNGLVKIDNIAVYKQEVLESISLNYTKLELKPGASQTLIVSKKPSSVNTGTVKWKSADTKIATVDANGKVTGISKGTTIITAELDGKTASCTVIVEAAADNQGGNTGGSGGGGGGGGAPSSPSKAPSPSPDVTPVPSQVPAATIKPENPDNNTGNNVTATPAPDGGGQDVNKPDSTDKDTNNKVSYNNKKYNVTSNPGKTAEYKKPSAKDGSNIKIPATIKVTVNGKKVTYKVTSIKSNAFKNNKKVKQVIVSKNIKKIGKNAFKNCSKIKKIKIKSSSIKKIGKDAFKGINKKCVIEVPKAKKKAYKKMLRKAGLNKKIKIVVK